MTKATYDDTRYKRWALPHPMLLHWIINPGLAFNEVILGQRIPKLMLIDQTSTKPLMERTFVPCPECGALHDGRLWAKGKAFGHWFGYVCPDCTKVIPCLRNLTSFVLLAVTFPAWIVPVLLWRERWLEIELTRVRAARAGETPKYENVPWIRIGVLGFGGAMWLLMGVLPQIVKEALRGAGNWRLVTIQFPIWLIGGLIFGAVMKLMMGRKGKATESPVATAKP